MTKDQKERYQGPEVLIDILRRELIGKRFLLQCGHHISFGHQNFGNDLTVRNGKDFKVICAQCGY